MQWLLFNRNYNFYTEQKWGKASNYTLCLNSSLTDIRRI